MFYLKIESQPQKTPLPKRQPSNIANPSIQQQKQRITQNPHFPKSPSFSHFLVLLSSHPLQNIIHQFYCPSIIFAMFNLLFDSLPNNILFKKNSMKYIYVMVPLAQIQQHADIVSEVEGLLKLSKHCFQVKEIEENFLIVDVKDFELGFLEIERIVKQCMNLEQKIELYEEIVKNYKLEDYPKQQLNEATNIESLVRKAKKAKQLKEENKKLKKLLQLQLQNTQKVREETQKTMRTLKEQFDALVEEMNGRETKENTIKNERKEHGHREKEKRNIKRQLNF